MERKENRFIRKKKEEESKPFNKSFYGKKNESSVGVNKNKPAAKWQPNDDLKEQNQNAEREYRQESSHRKNKSSDKYSEKKSGFEKSTAGFNREKKYRTEESKGGYSKSDSSHKQSDRAGAGSFRLKERVKETEAEDNESRYEETSFHKKRSIFDKPEKRFDKPKRAYEPRKKQAPKGPSLPRAIKDPDDDSIRLNKFISNAGICSRREADELIKAGAVTVNGKVVTEMGYKIKRTDLVNYGGQGLKPERQVYILLNKPKDYITTSDDPQERRTVMELIKGACKERVYPVGRLDRNTTGLLLLTNDGELTDKITHPSFKQKKIYHVELDKPVKREHLKAIQEGVELEDGFIKADEADYVEDDASKKEIGITLHSGRNRIVRRIFEHFEYKVKKLDRVYFAGLTKKDLARGRWRFLTPMEVNMLKMVQ
jgi:23S rRNA pseudouridine2605 synthase